MQHEDDGVGSLAYDNDSAERDDEKVDKKDDNDVSSSRKRYLDALHTAYDIAAAEAKRLRTRLRLLQGGEKKGDEKKDDEKKDDEKKADIIDVSDDGS